MGITPQELRAILKKNAEPAPSRGGFVASHNWGHGHKPLTGYTSRQLQAIARGRKVRA